SHANGDAVGDLLENAGLRTVGNLWRNFHATVHGTRMQHDGVGFGATQTLGIELIQQNVVVGGKRGFVQAFGLHAQHKNNVRGVERFFDLKDTTDGAAGG